MVAAAYLEGTYSELYSAVTEDEEGMRQLFRQFSFPGGIPSHAAPETPGSINEGGELGYSLMHAYGAAFDNPDLLVACVIGDGEAETGPLAASWHSNKFLDPVGDGVVLPILHLNGYKIANPTVLARIPEPELLDLMRGYGYQPFVLDAGLDDDHLDVHARMASTLDEILDRIAAIKRAAAAAAHRPSTVADAGPPHAEGLDRAARGGRPAGRGDVPGAPGAAGRHAAEPRAPGRAGALAAVVPAGGAVRRRRPAAAGDPRRSRRPGSGG